jgi:hypothetical protein
MDDASTVLGVDDRVDFFENYFCSHGAKDRARETKSPYGMGRTPKNRKSTPALGENMGHSLRKCPAISPHYGNCHFAYSRFEFNQSHSHYFAIPSRNGQHLHDGLHRPN